MRVVFRRIVDDVQTEQIEDDRAVGSATQLELIDEVADAELVGEGGLQGGLTCAAAGDESPVDIEQANVHEDLSGRR